MTRALPVCAAAVGAFVLCAAPLAAQTIDLPLFSACSPQTPPELPERWRAVSVMAPFTDGQIDVGELVFDASAHAMRVSIYGLESGAVDLLITDTDTYQLSGPHRAPTVCKSLGRKFSLPARQWLSQKSMCVGEAPLGATGVQWWKSPAADGRTIWHWFKADTRLPYRTLLPERSAALPAIGDYALTYFPTFEAVNASGLSRLRDFCVAQKQRESAPAAARAQSPRELMAIENTAAEAERVDRLRALVPGLSREACAGTSLPRWPEQFVMTAIISPIRFDEVGPFPTILFYDWSGAEAQIARMFLPRARPPVLALLPVLQKDIGYHVQQTPAGGIACTPRYPGMVRPDWAQRNKCTCRGVLEAGAPVGSGAPTQILGCPIPGQQGRVMWNWYTTQGRPLVFAEAGAKGTGLMLADYGIWLPGQKVPASEFSLPPQCLGADKKVTPPIASHAERFTREAGASCSTCHTIPQ